MPNDDETERERHAAIGHMARTIGLELSAAQREGVAANFARIEALASLVAAFPLPDRTELGAVFVP